jgi:hypothetical protein
METDGNHPAGTTGDVWVIGSTDHGAEAVFTRHFSDARRCSAAGYLDQDAAPDAALVCLPSGVDRVSEVVRAATGRGAGGLGLLVDLGDLGAADLDHLCRTAVEQHGFRTLGLTQHAGRTVLGLTSAPEAEPDWWVS